MCDLNPRLCPQVFMEIVFWPVMQILILFLRIDFVLSLWGLLKLSSAAANKSILKKHISKRLLDFCFSADFSQMP